MEKNRGFYIRRAFGRRETLASVRSVIIIYTYGKTACIPGVRDLISWVFLLGVTLAVYQPAWNGTPLWDDDANITKPALRSAGGLARIWTEPGAACRVALRAPPGNGRVGGMDDAAQKYALRCFFFLVRRWPICAGAAAGGSGPIAWRWCFSFWACCRRRR
jgi:hypothetical protein